MGLIGLGKMGLSHLAIANSLELFSVTRLCDVNGFVGSAISRYVNAGFSRDYEVMCGADDVDAIVISVPTPLHFPMAAAALRARKHVFLEKPLTLDASQSRILSDQARDERVHTQVGYINRFNPVFAHLHHIITEETFGKIIYYSCEMRGNVVGEKGAEGWRKDHSSGGGCLYEYGSHCIDLALFLFGNVAELNRSTLASRVSTSVEDIVDAEVTHASGVRGRLFIDWADLSYRTATNNVIVGTESTVILAN
ncbi:MAG: Gfo/Idh/MocA family protein, partial [Candidatus Acidiferrales bacterium]